MADNTQSAENNGFLTFLQRLAQGISDQPGYDANRDFLTNIQATPQYIAAVTKSLESSDLPQPEKDRILEQAEISHAASTAVIYDLDYNFDNKIVSFANEVVVAGFNGDDAALARLEQEVIDAGGTMPELTKTETAPVVTTPPILPADSPAQPIQVVYAEPDPDALVLDPIVIEAEPVPDHIEYEVQGGDSLWKIAREHWGLESNAEIKLAVESIARENGLDKGADANHIDIGQILKLPDNPFERGQELDWAALDKDTKIASGFNRAFDVAASGSMLADNLDVEPSTRPMSRPAEISFTG